MHSMVTNHVKFHQIAWYSGGHYNIILTRDNKKYKYQEKNIHMPKVGSKPNVSFWLSTVKYSSIRKTHTC